MNPTKYLIKDLKNKPVPFDVWLQGILERIVDDYVIISDSTGKVKVLGCDAKDKIVGAYCSVIGVAVSTSDVPEIKAAKFIKISSNHLQSWGLEVQEAQLVLQGAVAPKI